MNKGPKFNNIPNNLTTRDSLGIESVATSIQRELCPVINTVTPRAFYWIFMVWNYYDFIKNSGIKPWNLENFEKPFLKKNDYYFVLSNLLTPGSDQINLVGKDNTNQDINKNTSGLFEYNKEYFVAKYGGMQYYNAGCLRMGFISDEDDDGNKFKFPRITKELGAPMAEAFQKVIENTRYYKEYRNLNTKVPKEVLEEFGKIVSLDLKNFEECKKILRKALFEPKKNIKLDNEKLLMSTKYIQLLHEKYNVKDLEYVETRKILYDYFSPRGDFKYDYPEELKEIIGDWEIVIGRQYFTLSIELIWKYMLYDLNGPKTLEDWINSSLNTSHWNIDIKKNLSEYIDECNYSFEEREMLITKGYNTSKKVENNIENAIKVLLTIYNRFKNRDDLNQEYLQLGDEISIISMIEKIDEYKEKPVYEFLIYIMNHWIVKQHEKVAFNKLVQGRDGYFYEKIDDLYMRKTMPEPMFQGVRMIQLNQVMKDLDMWS